MRVRRGNETPSRPSWIGSFALRDKIGVVIRTSWHSRPIRGRAQNKVRVGRRRAITNWKLCGF